MQELEARALVHSPPPAVYEHLVDFPRYAEHSRYLERVTPVDGGEAGRAYDIRAGWWRLQHTVRSTVTELSEPDRIAWRIDGDLAAGGEWDLRPTSPPGDAASATDLRLAIRYDPASAAAVLDLPALVPVESVLNRAASALTTEAERVLESVVRDIDGPERSVAVEVTPPGTVDA